MGWIRDNLLEINEIVTFGDTPYKASLKESTKAVYSLANRACYFEGNILVNDSIINVGDYFIRECDNNNYFVSTLLPEPTDTTTMYIYCVKCNVQLTIQREKQTGTNPVGKPIIEYVDVEGATDILGFRDISTRSDKVTNSGSLDQTIYTLTLPQTYVLSKGDRIIMPTNIGGAEASEKYEVESTGNQLVGVTTAQLTKDIR